jgi:hypothetical protein
MLTRATAVAGALAILFLAPSALAHPNKGCGARYRAASNARSENPMQRQGIECVLPAAARR